VGSETVSAVHHGPAHTGGDSVVTFDRANIVHMGDLVFNRRMPVLDRPGGCRIEGWIGVLDKVMKEHQADTIYVFGHGKPGLAPTGSREDLVLQRDFLAALLDRVRGDVKAGRSRDDVVKAVGELKGFAEHGPLTERVLTAAWEEVTGQP
jgi:cyclase